MKSDKSRPNMTQVNCFECRHFFVTWDAAAPRGCRAFGFKTRQMPAQVVQASSGQPCQLFEPKLSAAKKSGAKGR